jgi:hypothetical protein
MFETVAPSLFVVLAEPSPEREAELNNWYDKVHGPDALENGSFNALHRYRAVGPGWKQARYLALWEGPYLGEPEAWAYIRPRAKELYATGRIGDVPSVVWALMAFLVPSPATGGAPEPGPAQSGPKSLTTVQSDWRHPDPGRSAGQWWKSSGLDDAPPAWRASLYTSDPDGGGGGYHLALFEQSTSANEAIGAWSGIGAPGMSPTPPYRTIFADETAAAGHRDGSASGEEQAPGPEEAWVMHWEHVASLS